MVLGVGLMLLSAEQKVLFPVELRHILHICTFGIWPYISILKLQNCDIITTEF